MIVLENGDLIEGDATSATEVDFTIYGLDNNALKQLADGQLANAKGTIYTADSTDVVTAIILVNTGAAHNHVNLYFKAAASRRLIPKDLQLESGYSLHFEGGKCVILTTGGAIVETTDISILLDDTAGGTNALTTKAPTSNVMYDHGVATTGIHGAGASTLATVANIATHEADTSTHGVTTIAGLAETQTLTDKRITPRITTVTSNAMPTFNTDYCDALTITAQAEAITSMTSNLYGTPTNFQKLIIRILDNGTNRAIAWGTSFVAKGVALPTTTTANKLLTVGLIFNTVTSKWECVASVVEA